MNNPIRSELPLPPPGKTGWPWVSNLDMISAVAESWPRISIVTPSFNQAQFLEETIRSVLLQGYPNLEYIIIDGGSNDGSVEIIKKYSPWLTFWVSEKDNGQTYAIEKGMRIASGVLVNWLNSDDLLLPGALFQLAQSYKNHNCSAGVYCGGATIIDGSGKTLRQNPIVEMSDIDRILPSAPPYAGGIQASWFVTKAEWDRLGGIDLKLSTTMDTDLYYRLNDIGIPFFKIEPTIAVYRQHNDTITQKRWWKSIRFKKNFYYKRLNTLTPFQRFHYRSKVRRLIFGFYMSIVQNTDPFWVKCQKILLAISSQPSILLEPFQVKRILKMLFLNNWNA